MIIVTEPHGRSGWIDRRLVPRARAVLPVPTFHVVVDPQYEALATPGTDDYIDYSLGGCVMPHDVIMPKIGMYLEDIRLVEWFVAEGGEVRAGDVLFTLETDKITSDVEAEAAGYLHRRVEENALVAIGTIVGAIAESREEYEQLSAAAPAEAPAGFAPAQAELFLGAIRAGETPATLLAGTSPPPAPATKTRRADGRLVSPRARALITEAGLGPEAVEAITATGPGGRITDRDVQAFLDAGGELEPRREGPATSTSRAHPASRPRG